MIAISAKQECKQCYIVQHGNSRKLKLSKCSDHTSTQHISIAGQLTSANSVSNTV
jgi:hypothetical protein